MRIAKPHSPIEILKVLFKENLSSDHIWLIQHIAESNMMIYHGYIGLSDKNTMQRIFLNNKPICSSLILKLIKISFKETLSLDEEFNIQNKNIFIVFFLTLPKKEFTYIIEKEKKCVMFYDIHKILSSIKSCIFKRLSKENTVYAGSSYLTKRQPLKKMYLRSKTPVFNNKHNKYFRSLMKKYKKLQKSRIAMIGFKRDISRCRIDYSKKPHNESNNADVISSCIKKDKNNRLPSASRNFQMGIKMDINSMKHTVLRKNFSTVKSSNIENLYSSRKYTHEFNNEKSAPLETTGSTCLQDSKITKNIYNHANETGMSCTNSANVSIKSKKILYNYRNSNDCLNTISVLSEWSDWTNCMNDKPNNSMKNIYNILPKNNTGFQQSIKRVNQFDFLPRKLCNLLQYRHAKLTNVKCFDSSTSAISRKWS